MSWFGRIRSFVEAGEILASDFEAEFDNIAEAFDGLFQAERVPASSTLTLTTSMADVPGTSHAITLARNSLVLVTAVASTVLGPSGPQAYCLSLNKGAHTLKLRAKKNTVAHLQEIVLNVDGADQAQMVVLNDQSEVLVLSQQITGYTYLVVPA